MKSFQGIMGYFLMIICAAFINAPILSLLAIPLFLLGSVFFIRLYLSNLNKEKINGFKPDTIVLIGSILITLLIFYSAIEFTSYLEAIYQSEFKLPINNQRNMSLCNCLK